MSILVTHAVLKVILVEVFQRKFTRSLRLKLGLGLFSYSSAVYDQKKHLGTS